MKVVSLAQQKGGVCKSTLAVHLAAEAQLRGLKSVIVEIDRQGTSTMWHERRGDRPPDVMQQSALKLDQTLTTLRGLGAAVVVLDLPGADNPGVTAALKASDFVLVPTRPTDPDMVASQPTLAAIRRLKKAYAYVLTFVEAAAPRAANDADEYLRDQGCEVCPHRIARRQAYSDAVAAGHSVMEDEPRGKAAAEIAALWEWLADQMGIEDGKSVQGKARKRSV
jgi:chromosome partitioning protein